MVPAEPKQGVHEEAWLKAQLRRPTGCEKQLYGRRPVPPNTQRLQGQVQVRPGLGLKRKALPAEMWSDPPHRR